MKFPYHDLKMSVSLLKFVPSNLDESISVQQLSLASGHSKLNGTIRLKISSAKQFGLIDSNDGQVFQTKLGSAIRMRDQDVALLRTAFFNIEMYQKIVSIFREKDFPELIEDQNAIFYGFGLRKSTAQSARIAFLRSADYANIFVPRGGKMRVFAGESREYSSSPAVEQEGPDVLFQEQLEKLFVINGRDPLLANLIYKIPRDGTWSTSDRKKWIAALDAAMDLIYRE